MSKLVIALLICGGLVVLGAGCDKGGGGGPLSKVNKENYDKVNTGMTADEVTAILGQPDTKKGGGGGAVGVEVTGTTMVWKSGDKTITVVFLNDKVVSKSQSNL